MMKNLFKQPSNQKGISLAEHRARRSMRLTIFESSFTEGLIAMSIMTLFYTQELGLNQAEVALSQSIFYHRGYGVKLPTWVDCRPL